jgi:SAM-dependent methyltransferase
MLTYTALNKSVANLIPLDAKNVLDIGCGDGSLGGWLQQRQVCTVSGITYAESEAIHARQHLKQVWVANLNTFDFSTIVNSYDCIICSHVLEHLITPHKVVEAVLPLLSPNGTLIIAIPNVLFFKQRFQFMIGNFRYEKSGGLMDETHYRFFDWQTVNQLIAFNSLKLEKKYATGFFPLPVIRNIMPGLAARVDSLMARLFPGFFGVQFLLVARKVK